MKYDVIISFRGKDEYGLSAPEAALAAEIKKGLEAEGLRVLSEDAPGLDEARVMLALAAGREVFRSDGLLSRWKGFAGEGGELIMVCRYLYPEELPQEFRQQKYVDAGKVGYLRTLLSEVRAALKESTESSMGEAEEQVQEAPAAEKEAAAPKPTEAAGAPETAKVPEPAKTSESAAAPEPAKAPGTASPKEASDIAGLMLAAREKLEDGMYFKAGLLADGIIKQHPDYAPAYVLKLLAKMNFRNENELTGSKKVFETEPEWQSATEHATQSQKQIYEAFLAKAKENRFDAEQNEIYERGRKLYMDAKTKAELDAAKAEFTKIPGYRDSEQMLSACEDAKKNIDYREAEKLVNEGLYEKAAEAFKALGEYGDAPARAEQCTAMIRIHKNQIKQERANKWYEARTILISLLIVAALIAAPICYVQYIKPGRDYKKALRMMDDGSYTDARDQFVKLEDFKDSREMVKECDYRAAGKYLQEGRYLQAYFLYESISGYKDASTIASENENILKTLDDWEIGGRVELGIYPQDSGKSELYTIVSFELDTKNVEWRGGTGSASQYPTGVINLYDRVKNTEGAEPISWIILDRFADGTALLISEYALDAKPYGTEKFTANWATSSVRIWLNDEFYRYAFEDVPGGVIRKTGINVETNTSYSYTVEDKVYLLSSSEIGKYKKTLGTLACSATGYAKYKGASVDAAGMASWWLRSEGYSLYYVKNDGTAVRVTLQKDATEQTQDDRCVRPAILVDTYLAGSVIN